LQYHFPESYIDVSFWLPYEEAQKGVISEEARLLAEDLVRAYEEADTMAGAQPTDR